MDPLNLKELTVEGFVGEEEKEPSNELLELLKKRKENNMKESAMALIAGGIGEALSGGTGGSIAKFGNELAMNRLQRGEQAEDLGEKTQISQGLSRFKAGLESKDKKPLTKSNVLETYDPVLKKNIYSRVEDALGRPVPISKEDSAKSKKDKSALEKGIRQQYMSTPTVKDFQTLQSSFSKIKSIALDQPSPAGDISLVFNYMKMLDPGSTVREGEQATAANARGLDDSMRTLYNRVLSGEKLTPTQRADFYNKAGQVYESQSKVLSRLQEEFRGISERSGADPRNVVVNFGKGDLTVDKVEIDEQNGYRYLIITKPDGTKEAKSIGKVE